MTTSAPTDVRAPYLARLLLWLAGLTACRIAVLLGTDLGLHGDEAQYWSWSRDLAWGYYTKPPMIAYVIKATTSVCGDATWCVRLGSPLLHAGTSLAIFCATLALADSRRAAFWAALTFATLPAVSFSSLLISTDVPLLCAWAVAMLAFKRLLDGGGTGWAVLLGLALGLGLLSKYAMAYFILSAALYGIFTPSARAFLLGRRAAIALAVAFLVFLPNLFWNVETGWVTFGHVRDNANLKGHLFNPKELLDFLGEQAGVVGPLLFLALLWRLVRLRAERPGEAERLALFFALPVLAIVLVQAFVSRANANWAAVAYVAVPMLLAIWLLERNRVWLLKASLALHLAAAAVLGLFYLDLPGLPDPLKSDPRRHLRGWDEVADTLRPMLAERPQAIWLTEDRMVMASLLYALRDVDRRPRMWDYDGHPDHHYELMDRYLPKAGDEVLLVSNWDRPFPILDSFAAVEDLGTIQVPVSRTRSRSLHVYFLRQAKPTP